MKHSKCKIRYLHTEKRCRLTVKIRSESQKGTYSCLTSSSWLKPRNLGQKKLPVCSVCLVVEQEVHRLMAASCTDCFSSTWAAGSSPSLPLLSVYSSMFPFWFFARCTSLSTHPDTHSTSTASDKLVWTRYRVNSHM